MVLQTCAWSSSAACVSNPGDWYSKRASGGVRFSGCVEDSGRREVLVLRSKLSVGILGNAVFLVGANYLRGPRSVLIGPAEGTVRSCCRQ